jgi:hypothetical protein
VSLPIVAVVAAAAAALAAPTSATREAATLRRGLQYDAAAARLDAALPALTGDARADALVARAGLATDPTAARDFLIEAGRVATSTAARRRADLEIARLDLARGSYRGVRTRLQPYADDPTAAVLLGLAAVGLEEPAALDPVLQPARGDDTAQLLLGWAALQRGDPRTALARLEPLVADRGSDVLPTALLWTATAQAQLGAAQAAAQTSAALRARFPDAPETDAAARAVQAPVAAPEVATHGERVTLQIAAFEDRGNALRYREAIAAALPSARVDAAESGGRRVYRVCLGDFPARDAAEAFARAELDRRGLAWQVVRLGPEPR